MTEGRPEMMDLDDTELWEYAAQLGVDLDTLPTRILTAEELDAMISRLFPEDKGGPGSGHYGHRGRPGHRGGSLPGGAYLGLPAKLRRSTRRAIADLQEMTAVRANIGLPPIEHAIAINEEGWRVGGDGKTGIIIGTSHSIPNDVMPHPSKFDIFIHVHPIPSSFSGGDIGYTLKHEIKHEIVISPDGFMGRLSRTADTADADRAAEASMLWDGHARERYDQYWRGHTRPETDAEYARAMKEYSHFAAKRVAENYGLDYAWDDPEGKLK